ncbi:DUF2304 domain-containing protein [Nanoarchaeota archaeon]
MEYIQIILLIFGLFALSRAVIRYKKKDISIKELLFWGIIWLAVIVFSIMPNSLNYLSRFFGIGRPIDLLIYGSIILLFYLIFRLYVKIDNIEQEITKVTRATAINKEKKKK